MTSRRRWVGGLLMAPFLVAAPTLLFAAIYSAVGWAGFLVLVSSVAVIAMFIVGFAILTD